MSSNFRKNFADFLDGYKCLFGEEFRDGYIEAFFELLEILSDKDRKSYEKRFLESFGAGFNNYSLFVQVATELAVSASFQKRFPDKFCRDVIVDNGLKNCDFSFRSGGDIYYVECKSFSPPDFSKYTGIKIFHNVLAKAVYEKGKIFDRNVTASLGRFLKDANSQLSHHEGVKVLLLSCWGPSQFADVLECICGPNGFFSSGQNFLSGRASNKILPYVSDVPNIDVVVVCQQAVFHDVVFGGKIFKFDFCQKSMAKVESPHDCWSYEGTFPIQFFLRESSKTFHEKFVDVFQSLGGDFGFIRKKFDLDCLNAFYQLLNHSFGKSFNKIYVDTSFKG